MRVRLTP